MPDKYEMNHKVIEAMKEKFSGLLHEFDESTEHAVNVNTQLLMRVLNDCKDTEYGQKYGFSEIHNTDEYRQKVPLSTYDDYESYIDRMTNGEKNLITSYPIAYYAQTSGTTGGKSKYVPLSDKAVEVLRNYATDGAAIGSLLEFHRTTRLKDIPDGFFLLVLSLSQHKMNDGTPYGSLSADWISDEDKPLMPYFNVTPAEVMFCNESANLKYLHAFFALSERKLVLMHGTYIPAMLDLMHYIQDNWKTLVSDIRTGTLSKNVIMPDSLREELSAKISPDPERADELEREFTKGFDNTIMSRIWPDLSGIMVIWAGNFSSYARKLQEFSGRSMPYHTLSYSASEGIYAMARHPFDQYYVMLPASCFYEFIPANSCDDDNPATVLIGDVQEGKDYELVITNQSGFYRYRTGDVIRVIGFYNESPMIVFKYRTKSVMSLAGEKFTEDDLAFAVKEFERKSGINVVDFCMYPDRSVMPGRYVVIIEPEEKVPASRMEECTNIMEQALAHSNEIYALLMDRESYFGMSKLKLIFLQPQTFQLYREIRMYKMGLTENQLKTIRFLNTPELVSFFTGLEDK